MGGVEVGLKQGSFGFGLKQSVLQPQQEELYGVVFGSSAGDDSFVDQFLNLQNADNPQEVDHHLENQQINSKNSAFLPLPPSPPLHPTAAAAEDDLCGVLTLPEEEPELEWLSQFMEDSFSIPYPTAAGIPAPPENETAKSPVCFSASAALPRSRRSKRRRSDFLARGPVWPISPSSATESTTSSSSSSSATSSPWPPTSPSTPLALQSLAPKPNKKRKNRASSGPGSGSAGLARRCSHCGSQKTPQWRAGPNGAKTLCNACGVRFKSGRLLPEYRPASSPSFSCDVHSNSHRKVIEMRRKKEMTGQPEPGSDSALTTFG